MVTGHDLSNEEDRKEFFTGFERERCKLELCIWKLKNPGKPMDDCNPELECTDENQVYMRYMKKKLIQCTNVKDFGKILMQPAPWKL